MVGVYCLKIYLLSMRALKSYFVIVFFHIYLHPKVMFWVWPVSVSDCSKSNSRPLLSLGQIIQV